MSAPANRSDGPPRQQRLRISDDADTPSRDVTWDVLSEKIKDLIVLADATGTIIYASPACRAFGYEPHELVGKTATDFTHPDDLEHMSANTRALFNGEVSDEPPDREHRIRRKDGSWVWLEGNPSLVRGPDGEPIALLNVFRDVTQNRMIRDALWEQTRRASMAESVAGVGYWRLDALTQEIFWSDQMFRIYGLEPGREPALDAAMAMTHPDDDQEAKARLETALATGQTWSDALTRIVHPNGETHLLSGSAVCECDRAGRITALFGTVVDVTEQRRAQQSIEASERRYRLLTDHATDMITRTSIHGRILYLSPSVARTTGYSLAELMPRKMREFVHPEDLPQFLDFYSALVAGRTEEGQPIRYRVRHKDGSWFWLESIPRLVRSTVPGEPDDIVDVSRNTTEQEALKARLQAALVAAEQAALVKSAFLANMSHEIRTPLTAVLGFTSLLEERTDLDAEAKRQLGRIAGASRALLALVNDVLDFSKLEAGQTTVAPRPTAAQDVVGEVLDMFTFQALEKALDLRLSTRGAIPASVSIDADRLRQILTNLIGNAVKFTERGSVSVSLDYDAGAQRLGVSVTDTGPGVAAAARERLFQRFSQVEGSSTRSKGGTGLGLAICLGLAEAMDGSITLRSRVGRGSTFRLEVAAPTVAMPATIFAPASWAQSLDGVRVLVADDNIANRDLVRAILESVGVEVSEACDGLEAVAAAQGLPVDAILMDLRMPGQGGRAAAAQIRATVGPNQDTPILAFSADGESAELEIGRNALFNAHLRKPMEPGKLLSALRQVLTDAGAPSQEVKIHAAL
ncbi:PAS domain S-box protein [Phenylobacterium sp.]|uniref:PAS domain S-box protein n=1 Tax=Phenylobacterium sp. TaxID=1871053 RepID=UPI00286A8341|nr:PAS domain S-box protein [Phenylobacterium sp.]